MKKSVKITNGTQFSRFQAMDLKNEGVELLYVSVPSVDLAQKISDNVDNATFGMGFDILFELPEKPA